MFFYSSRTRSTPQDWKKAYRTGIKFLLVGIALFSYFLYQAGANDLTFQMLEHEQWKHVGMIAVLGGIFSAIGGILVAITTGLVKKSCPSCGAVASNGAVSCEQCEQEV